MVVEVVGYVLTTVIHLGQVKCSPIWVYVWLSHETSCAKQRSKRKKVKKRVCWVEFAFMLYTKATEINKSQHS